MTSSEEPPPGRPNIFFTPFCPNLRTNNCAIVISSLIALSLLSFFLIDR